MILPAAPPGGGYLVLTPNQFRDPALTAAIREAYPNTRLIEAKPIPLDTRRGTR